MFPSIQFARASTRESVRAVSVAELLERSAGLVLLLASLPILFTAALAVAALSRRSPLVAHLRVGKNNTPFWMLKLRSMWNSERPEKASLGWIEFIDATPSGDSKDPRDPRVTSRLAAVLRRHSIDELPQLWHVFRGEMSFVGPRPLTRSELVRHYGVHSGELLSVKPGLTGLWQTSGRSTVPFPKRAEMDLELVRGLTWTLYLLILLRTCSALVRGQGAW